MTIDEAMVAEDRRHFLPESVREYASEDRPLPIGSGATNSQPSTVRSMLELLDAQVGDRVLDVGSGSGWTTAILSRLVGVHGSVIGLELEPTLVAWSRENLGLRGNVRIEQAYEGVLGWPESAPYDRILVSAMADELPQELVDQLADGGVLVAPIDSVMTTVRRAGSQIRTAEHGRYRFVPLRRK